MNTHTNLSRLTIDIPKEDHTKLKTIAAATGKSMRNIVLESIELYMHNFESADDNATKLPKALSVTRLV